MQLWLREYKNFRPSNTVAKGRADSDRKWDTKIIKGTRLMAVAGGYNLVSLKRLKEEKSFGLDNARLGKCKGSVVERN